MFKELLKAAVGVTVKTPISVIADIVTMGGVITGKQSAYTCDSIKEVMKNVDNAVNPHGK